MSNTAVSLKATFIRQAIQRALNKSRIHHDRKLDVPYLLVYEFPTVQRLTEWVKVALSGSAGCELLDSTGSHITAIQAMVDKYSLPSPPCESQQQSFGPQCAPRTLLITGTTGALGSHLLYQTAHDPKIKRIYALGRSPLHTHLQAKQKAILEFRGLSSEFLDSPKVVMVAAETLDNVPMETLTEV